MSNIKPYAVELVHVQPDDIILLHISEDMSFDDLNVIQREIQQACPNNTILVANEHILKKITIFRPEKPIEAYDSNDLLTNSIDDNLFVMPSSYLGTKEGTGMYDVLY